MNAATGNEWPELDFAEWKETLATLHRWTQIVGKVRLRQTPWVNHSWHVPLYLTARGLTTSVIPHDTASFQLDFDFIDHRLVMNDSRGEQESFPLEPISVATFYEKTMTLLERAGLEVAIHEVPNEIEDAVPFSEDHDHASYDPDYAQRFWRALLLIEHVFIEFRARFIGKNSPVHFFWGSFDLAVTRFSGRPAPPHPGGFPNLPDWITREAYSHEVSSAGFWPGGEQFPQPLFYSYAYPTPDGFGESKVRPESAFWSDEMGEFVLPYDAVRTSPSPEETLMKFLETTYAAAADLAGWDRRALERDHEPGP